MHVHLLTYLLRPYLSPFPYLTLSFSVFHWPISLIRHGLCGAPHTGLIVTSLWVVGTFVTDQIPSLVAQPTVKNDVV